MSVTPEAAAAAVDQAAPPAVNRIDACFDALRSRGEKGLIAYITAGDPDIETTRQAVLAMAAAGADVIELGLPFSDPLADGPVIQRAAERALAGGFRVRQIFELARAVRLESQVPLAVMTYCNPVLRFGTEAFVKEAAAAGIDALLIPDMPFEESEETAAVCRRHGLHLIRFLAPTSTNERIAGITREATGFIYCVSLTGVTGARDEISSRLGGMMQRIRPHTSVPLAAGFGIGTPEQAAAAARWADAVIVGSAIVQLVAEGGGPAAVAERVGRFVAALKSALRAVR